MWAPISTCCAILRAFDKAYPPALVNWDDFIFGTVSTRHNMMNFSWFINIEGSYGGQGGLR